jgi:predicted GIY-YIG superfamily endonuclease
VPFEQFMPRPFSIGNVQKFAPLAPGVYGLSNAREWIYIGVSENIRSSLLEHLETRSSPLMKRQPTGFVYEVVCPGDEWARQDRLIQEYEPTCNRSHQALTGPPEQAPQKE